MLITILYHISSRDVVEAIAGHARTGRALRRVRLQIQQCPQHDQIARTIDDLSRNNSQLTRSVGAQRQIIARLEATVAQHERDRRTERVNRLRQTREIAELRNENFRTRNANIQSMNDNVQLRNAYTQIMNDNAQIINAYAQIMNSNVQLSARLDRMETGFNNRLDNLQAENAQLRMEWP